MTVDIKKSFKLFENVAIDPPEKDSHRNNHSTIVSYL